MSRVGNALIEVPAGVTIQVNDQSVNVSGPNGKLETPLVSHVNVKVEDGVVTVVRDSDLPQARSNHGLIRALVNNMVVGVTKGFEKQLQVLGVGYRADVRGSKLVMQLGYSHNIEYAIPDGISVDVDKANVITVKGIDKQQVGQVAAEIRNFRKPDHYKGKGVRYMGEYVRIKAGKSA